ncbi:MAG: cytochrome P450 [Myxococcales bacterium]|nr:cytochrome P450 [Myxococcales bacterium]
MRENAPVFFDPDGRVHGVSRHADVQYVSKHPELFCSGQSSRPDAPAMPSMINLDDPLHMQRRNLVNRGFTPRRVREHEPRIREICRELIAKVRGRETFDFVHEIAAPLPLLMIGDLLGVAEEDHDDLLRWSDAMIAGTRRDAPEDVAERAATAFTEFAEYHRRVVADRRASPRDDLVSILVHAEVDGQRLDDEALLHENLLILIGGDETTRHVISGGMEALIRNPEQRERLHADPARIPRAVEEMLRWVSPIANMNRTATRDVELHGQPIRKGDRLLLLYPSANRDDAVFDEPDRFDVDRDPNPHLAFGGFGAHFCLGASLARLELRVMFEELLTGLPPLALESDAPLSRTPSNFIPGIRAMPVRLAG